MVRPARRNQRGVRAKWYGPAGLIDLMNNDMKGDTTMKWTPTAIRRLRKKLEVTQEGLARLLDVSTVSVNRWERGHSEPSRLAMKTLDALAKK
jgi:DNA-binding transcriptional regulator YiaG